jgi:fructose-specific component phosphotransferase system IIB-like protein
MAEIKDVYSLEFNSSQFQTEINSAIQSIDQLNSAMEQGVDVADDLEAAQANLVSVLGTEAKGVEQLNQKRNVLVNTQKQVNAESKTGVTVGRQLDTTNKQIAVSTGQAATQQRGFTGSIIQGARQIGSMRRVVSQLGFAFRLMGSLLPFGLIMSFAGPVLSFFGSLFTTTDKTAENMEKLADSTTTLGEKISIAEVEMEKLNIIEGKRGKLTDEEEKRRRELVKTYKETSEQIIQEEEDRFLKISGMQIDTERIRIKLRGESIQQIKDSAELERKAINLANEKQRSDAYRRMQDALKERDKLRNMGFISESIEQDKIASQAEDEWRAINQLQNAQIDQLNKDTTKAINDFIKKSNEDQRKKALDAANKSIEDETNRLKEIILRTEEGTMERVEAEANLIDQLLILRQKYAKELELDDTELTIMQLEGLEEREKLIDKYYENLKEKKDKNKDAIIGPTREDLIQKLKELNDALKAELDIIENNNEATLAKQLAALETERNDKLIYAAQNITDQEQLAKAFEDIDEGYNNARKQIEKKANIEILNQRIALLESLKLVATNSNDKAAEAELNKQIEQAKLQVIELNKINTDGAKQNADRTKAEQKQKEEDDKEALDKQKELIDQTTQLIQGVSDNVFNVLNAQVQAYIEGLDKAIDKSKSALDEIRSNSENYNARQLEIEKERLEKLEAERARAVEREKNLAQVQVAINAAIAISKAAAEGGGVASAITIALTLASLVAGFAQARVAAGNAFYHGVEYLERGQNKAGRDTIPAMLNEGERVITTDTNNKYWDVLSAVHNNRIPADVLNTFSKAYQQGGIKNALGAFGDNVSLSSELGQKSIFVNVAQTYGGLENRLERIENVLTELPKYMPRTTVSANANGIFKIVEQRQARKNFSKNWSK